MPAWQTNETATFNLGHDPLDLPLGDGSFTAHYYWQSATLSDLRNFNSSQRAFAYGLLNLRLEFRDFLEQRNVDFALYANNVANTPACLPEFNGVLNSGAQRHLRHRQYLRPAAMHPAGAADGRGADQLQILGVRSGWPKANGTVQWTVSSDERPGESDGPVRKFKATFGPKTPF